MLARGGVVVEQLHWNMTLRRVHVTLRSARAQSLVLRFGIPLRFVDAENPTDRELISRDERRNSLCRMSGCYRRRHCP